MKIKSINEHGNSLELKNKNMLLVNYHDRNEILSWSCDTEVEIIKTIDLFWPYVLINKATEKKIKTRHLIESILIPQDKFDIEVVERIKRSNSIQIKPILPYLFEWTEDINWPIASKLAEALAVFGTIIIPFVIHYLRNPLGLNEYGVYYHLIPLLKKEHLGKLENELEIILKSPTDFQKSEEYDIFALKYLLKLKCYSW